MHGLAVAPCIDNRFVPEQPKMLGHGGLAQFREQYYLVDRPFSLQQAAQDFQPVYIRQGRHQLPGV